MVCDLWPSLLVQLLPSLGTGDAQLFGVQDETPHMAPPQASEKTSISLHQEPSTETNKAERADEGGGIYDAM